MTIHSNEELKVAIHRAVDDGAIPTDRPIYAFYIDFHCPECEQCTRGISQIVVWSHIGGETTRPQEIECFECGNESMQLKTWVSEWDAPLENLPPSAIPERYR